MRISCRVYIRNTHADVSYTAAKKCDAVYFKVLLMYLNSVTRMCVYEGIPLTAIILLNPMLYIYIYVKLYIYFYMIFRKSVYGLRRTRRIYTTCTRLQNNTIETSKQCVIHKTFHICTYVYGIILICVPCAGCVSTSGRFGFL